jgi:ABC-type molybdenum transport system ATPase subunit/photorepair protein PhrA
MHASCRGHETTCALVAQALVHKPQVIVLDSPPPAWTSNFDKRSQFIAKLNKQRRYGAVDTIIGRAEALATYCHAQAGSRN